MVGIDKLPHIHFSKTAAQIMKIFCGINNHLAESLWISESEKSKSYVTVGHFLQTLD